MSNRDSFIFGLAVIGVCIVAVVIILLVIFGMDANYKQSIVQQIEQTVQCLEREDNIKNVKLTNVIHLDVGRSPITYEARVVNSDGQIGIVRFSGENCIFERIK